MGLAYVIVGVLSAAVAVFALENNQTASLRFVSWTIENVPLASAVLAALAVGLILAAVPLSFEAWRWRSRARQLESRIEMLELTLANRDRETVLMAPRSVAAPRSA